MSRKILEWNQNKDQSDLAIRATPDSNQSEMRSVRVANSIIALVQHALLYVYCGVRSIADLMIKDVANVAE